ncbi:efflux RND transporter periplasmic adaptor subunit [Opitutus sp. ER46]|uniref:efflux RND transporter periplasmic adaptor subunit n=1 Tax=Opitutus sp. ER46 TaxID=2161864 RepID=UPI000D3254F9|nr:efflux RND transporter periplasmic adaptor subunit [Opitutus sp. ER46]PTX95499.1 efflux RND transporter periplasmic adaptor subunit [Opitutus sp. ER46]
MKKLLAGLLLVGLAGGVCLLHFGARPVEPAASSGVETVIVARRDLGLTVKATGVIKPRVGAEVRVGSRLSGVVNRLYVQVGDAVTAGQLLAELDVRDLVARRHEAEATLERALAELRYADATLQRHRTLRAAQAVSADDLEVAERAGAVARQQVAVARASLAYAATQVDYARIVAPISGVVASVATQEGETVSASLAAPTFVTLIDLSRLEVWAYVDETDIGRIQLGQTARFTVDTYGEEEFAGVVTAIYPKAEIRDNVVNYITVVRFEPPAGRVLRPEMTATVRVTITGRANALALPARAVGWNGEQAFVQVVRADGTTEPRTIGVGARDAEYVEITTGLQEGERVLASTLEKPNHD